jgi:eukaryotic-like serine/threonine-protein kinase
MSREPTEKTGATDAESGHGSASVATGDAGAQDHSTVPLPLEVDGSPREDQTPRLASGQPLLGRFTVVRFVASGGMGSVYEASDLTLRTRVALKVLRPQLVAQAGGLERFHREVLLARRVSHPNVCRVYELFDTEVDGAPLQFVTMELLEGETLARRLVRDRSLTTSQALPLVMQMCDGLGAAHAEGVIHRDFKTSNVVLAPRAGLPDRVVITDFGVARAVASAGDDSEALTGGGILGTPEYMAPEQVTGGRVSPATDVYALGVVMYEMVTGSRPFAASSPLAAAVRHINEPPPRPELAMPSLDPRWARTIHRCLEVDPSRRLQSVEEVAAALSGRRLRERWRWPVTFLAVLLLGAAAGVVSRRWVPAARPTPKSAVEPARSIAVLAFSDMSPGHDQEYFSDGVAQEIISALSEVPGLRVVARSSSFSFKGKNEDLRTVGQRLNVAHVLEGSVRKAGSQVRVTVQLVSTADGYQVWSRTFDREMGDILSVQAEIARSVATALQVKDPSFLAESRFASAASIAPEAYASYLRGQQLLNAGSSTDVLKAREEFEKALALEPGFAQVRAALAHAMLRYGTMATTSSEGTEADWRQRALDEAELAVALAPTLADAHVARAEARFALAEWDAAAKDYQQALAIAPANASALTGYAGLLATLGRLEEGVQRARLAAEFDPLSADAQYFLGSLYLQSGQYALAKSALGRAEALAPNHVASNFLGWNELLNGDPAEALRIFQHAPEAWARDWGVSLASHTLGNDEASRQALQRLIATAREYASYQIAEVYAWRGEQDRAFEWLDRALATHDTGLAALKRDPLLRGLRSDARYRALLTKLRLPLD